MNVQPVGGRKGEGRRGLRSDLHARRVGQGVAAPLTGDREQGSHHIVSGPGGVDEVAAGEHQLSVGPVIGGGGDGRRGIVGDGDAVAGQIRHGDRAVGTGGPILGGGQVVGGGTDRGGPILVQQGLDVINVGPGQHDGELRVGGDLHIGGGRQGIGGAALAGEGQFGQVDIVGGPRFFQQSRAGHHQGVGGMVVGGGGDGGDGDVADGDAVAGGVHHVDGGIGPGHPIFRSRQVIGGAAGGGGAVLVEDLVDRCLVRRRKGNGEGGAGGNFDIGRIGQGPGVAALAGEGEQGGVDIVGHAGIFHESAAGHRQGAGGGVVGGRGDGGGGDVADGDAVAGGVHHVDGGVGAGGPVFRRRQVVAGGAVAGLGAVLVEDQVDGGPVGGAQGDGEGGAGGDLHVGRIGQGPGIAALDGKGEQGGIDIVARAAVFQKPGTSHHQCPGCSVIGGRGDGGGGDVADGDTGGGVGDVAGGQGRGQPVVCRRQIEGGHAVAGLGAVLVEDQVDGGLVGGVQGEGEGGAGGEFHIRSADQGVGVAALAGEGEQGGVNVRSARLFDQVRSGHHQGAAVGVVGGGGDRRGLGVADGDGTGRIGGVIGGDVGDEVIGGGQVVGGRAVTGLGAVLVQQPLDIDLVGVVQGDGELRGAVDLHVGAGQGVGVACLAGEGEFGDGDIVGYPGLGLEVGAGDDQGVAAGIIGGRGDGRGLEHIGDGDGDGLDIGEGAGAVVGGCHLHHVGVVAARVGGVFKVGRRLKGQDPRAADDAEFGLIRTAGDGEGDGVAVGIGIVDIGDGGLVFRRIDRSGGPAAIRADDRVVVDGGDVDVDRRVRGQGSRAIGGADGDRRRCVAAGIARAGVFDVARRIQVGVDVGRRSRQRDGRRVDQGLGHPRANAGAIHRG